MKKQGKGSVEGQDEDFTLPVVTERQVMKAAIVKGHFDGFFPKFARSRVRRRKACYN